MMKKLIQVLIAGSIIAALALGSASYAAEDHNSSRSNMAHETPTGPSVTYSFNFNLTIDPSMDALSRSDYETLVDNVFATAKKDLMKKYDGKGRMRRR